jgi:adenosylmethionine-8-amino-7-oxononanoate aminotransferase
MAHAQGNVRSFVRGEGNYLIDADGRRIFDAVSSIWTTVHGHCHPAIVAAIARQAAVLDHATLLGARHPLAEELAARIAALTGLDHVLFAGDGASAVETALKLAVHYWQEQGEPQRTRFVHLVHAYHGDTAGAMSVSDIGVFKQRYGALTFETRAYDGCDSLEGDDLAAVIVEPIVQAAAGMRIVPREAYDAVRASRALLIVDEIATGFGRTGTMFAYEQLSIRADVLCLGKSLSGGTLPISATVVNKRIFDAFTGRYDESKQLFHGHSFAGNPITCAAALANLQLFSDEKTLDRLATLTGELAMHLELLRSHPNVVAVRNTGLMIGIEIDAQRIGAEDAPTPAWRVAAELYRRGYFTRPIGQTIQLVPPLSSTPDELAAFCRNLHDILDTR